MWSAKDPCHTSENAEIEKVVDSIRAETRQRGIYVYDRYYAIADGVHDLFMRHARWNPVLSRKKERPNPQMDFDYSSA